MWRAKIDQFLRQAQDCKDRAAEARDPIDGDAWLKLAEEWLALARSDKAREDQQNPPVVNGHSAF
jgi:hypothetical protein